MFNQKGAKGLVLISHRFEAAQESGRHAARLLRGMTTKSLLALNEVQSLGVAFNCLCFYLTGVFCSTRMTPWLFCLGWHKAAASLKQQAVALNLNEVLDSSNRKTEKTKVLGKMMMDKPETPQLASLNMKDQCSASSLSQIQYLSHTAEKTYLF